jgi:hypothetical protein
MLFLSILQPSKLKRARPQLFLSVVIRLEFFILFTTLKDHLVRTNNLLLRLCFVLTGSWGLIKVWKECLGSKKNTLINTSYRMLDNFIFKISIISAVNASDDNPVTRNFFCRANGCCDQHEWCRFWAWVFKIIRISTINFLAQWASAVQTRTGWEGTANLLAIAAIEVNFWHISRLNFVQLSGHFSNILQDFTI